MAADPLRDGIVIRPMRTRDLSAAGGWAEREGWTSETVEDFEAFLAHDPAGCLILESGGEPAGVCVAIDYGGKGFIGEMIVSREARGAGLGPVLFDRAQRYLIGLGCASIGLDAVSKAVDFYASRGFRTVTPSRRFLGRIEAGRAPGVRPLERGDLPRVLTIDRVVFGADRSFFLRRRLELAPELAWIRTDGSRVTGYLFGRRRRAFVWAGPWWSPDAGGEEELLRGFAEGAGDTDLQIGVLDSNARALGLARSLGFAEKPHPSRRMAFGEGDPVGLHPSLLSIGSAAQG